MSALAYLNVVMYVESKCPWCKKMLELLRNEGEIDNITIIDANIIDRNGQYGKIFHGKGVPFFFSLKNRTYSVGYKPIPELIRSLTVFPGDLVYRDTNSGVMTIATDCSSKPDLDMIQPKIDNVFYIDATCAVCLEEITKVVTRPCKHAFCIDCNDKLTKCPKCKAT